MTVSIAQAWVAEHRDSPDNALWTGSLKVALSIVGVWASAVGANFIIDAEENEPASAALPIEAHVKELRDGAAAEIRAIVSPCLRDTLHVTHCSTMKRLIVDYSDLRQRIRAAREKNDDYDRAEDAIASEYRACQDEINAFA